ncbi:peptidase S8/S53 domain-containing protein [Bombardia bombarda]|uniref:Peptidase S8/S53 domain-containing protein n=1 Tax=Bombardia bombarda TaxID=252184 RepID=A0AA39X9C9_9PEZI|nr:peptidase S8/S53 domain-containing protein [Bombardia bombarda]
MLFSATLLLGLLPASLAVSASEALDKRAPLIQATSSSRAIPGNYIVKLKDSSTDAALNKALGKNKAGHIYKGGAFKGFAGAFDANSLEAIRNLPEVEYVEEDAVVTIQATVSQPNAPWNLARISSRTRGATTYRYDDSAGVGSCIYIIDTGIYTAHPEFGGRAVWGSNFADTSNTDGNGHGTAVAGVAGAITYGVAKRATLIAVKVLDASGSGTTSNVIAGFNYVATNYPTRNCTNGAVASISVGGSFSAAVNSAARSLSNAGVMLAVASGGSNTDAGGSSPGSEPLVCTVGASTMTDARASSSNYGVLVDIYAPGQNILTTWTGGSTVCSFFCNLGAILGVTNICKKNTLSSTSLAAAHIAGLGAYLLTLRGRMTATALCAYMQSIATRDVLTGIPSGPNLLAYNGIDL